MAREIKHQYSFIIRPKIQSFFVNTMYTIFVICVSVHNQKIIVTYNLDVSHNNIVLNYAIDDV